jgi:hypothetical protein
MAEVALLSPEDVRQIALRHVPTKAEWPECASCEQDWPCDASRLADDERAARAEPGLREAAQDVLDSLSGWHSDDERREVLARLRAALEAHGEPQEGER